MAYQYFKTDIKLPTDLQNIVLSYLLPEKQQPRLGHVNGRWQEGHRPPDPYIMGSPYNVRALIATNISFYAGARHDAGFHIGYGGKRRLGHCYNCIMHVHREREAFRHELYRYCCVREPYIPLIDEAVLSNVIRFMTYYLSNKYSTHPYFTKKTRYMYIKYMRHFLDPPHRYSDECPRAKMWDVLQK